VLAISEDAAWSVSSTLRISLLTTLLFYRKISASRMTAREALHHDLRLAEALLTPVANLNDSTAQAAHRKSETGCEESLEDHPGHAAHQGPLDHRHAQAAASAERTDVRDATPNPPSSTRARWTRMRSADAGSAVGSETSARKKKVRRPQGLDLIDKLDVTGIYGPSMIHHDGPYDAVQPHRNRKKDARAPMEAFPVGSANNSLGGSGPLNSKIDLDRIHGRGAEGFTDFGSHETNVQKPRMEAEFSAKGRSDIIHGEQTHGLGTSTFLEGAPASRKAVQEDMEAQAQKQMELASGLGRKKSIAQRFRGISQPRRAYGEGRIKSPEARYGNATSPNGPYSAGATSQTKATEMNPFFDEYNQAYDSKGASIRATEANKDGQSPPGRNALQRSVTSDSVGSPTNDAKPSGGFLNRVKSLKGGRRRPA
jgi:hypothetical protein